VIYYDAGMHIDTYPWSEGRCVLDENKWYFVDSRTNQRTFIEYRTLVVDSDHLEILVKQALGNVQVAAMN